MSRSALLFKPALAIVFLTFCVCKPGIGAAGNAREAASRPLVSRAEMYNRFKVGRWVENKRIRGKDLVALMVGPPVDIRIRNAMIEGGLDFRGVGAPACKSIRIIDASIRPASISQRARSTGSAVYAPDIRFAGTFDLSGTRIEGPVDFSRTSFSGGSVKWTKTYFVGYVDLSGSIFDESVLAQQATFAGGVTFSGAQFKQMAVFVDIDVKEKVDAAGSVFRERGSFRKSRFRKGATFRGAHFDKEASFTEAAFGGGAVFRNAVFSGPGKFDDAVFDAGVGFEGAAFHQSAAFNRVRFSERVRFADDTPPQGKTDPGATFHGEASFIFTEFVRGGRFTGVRFNDKAQFLDSRFGGPAQFSDAVFEDRAWFTTSVFHGKADFQETDFKGNTRFENTRFEGIADFLLARFHAEVTFDRATFDDAVMLEADFRGRVDFRGARFAGRADFAGRTFRGPADFEASTFESRAVFRGASFLDRVQFRQTRFSDTLVLDYAAFSSVADFRGAHIARLAFDCRTRPTVIDGRVDFRKAEIAASHFQDLVFASDVDLSDAVFGNSTPMAESTGDTADPDGTGSSPGGSNGTTLFRDVTFEGATYFIRSHFTGPLSLETVSFRGLSDWREAGFAVRDEAIPLLSLSYVTFSEANLAWKQLPPIRRWATETQRIPGFHERPAAQASEADAVPEVAGRPMQPRSRVLRDLETVFRRQSRLTDANQAHYYLKRAALKEARRKQGWMRRWPLELEWAGWGLLSGYGTRLSWVIGWCLLIVLGFASVYAAFGVMHRQQAPATDNDFSLRLRLLDLPRSYLKDAPVRHCAHPRLNTYIDALRLSAVILFKVGYRDTRISGRGGGTAMGWIVALEWLIGFFLIGMLLVTLTNTQPVLHTLLSQLF